jgi:hypothetical protein
VVILAFFVMLPAVANAQEPGVEWSQTYGGPADDVAAHVIEAPDGGLVFTGSTRSNSVGGSADVWLVKTDAHGEQVWSRSFGTAAAESARRLVATVDGGYLIVGQRVVNSGDMLIIKVDSAGNKVWEKLYGGFNNYTYEYGWSVVAHPDGTFAVAYSGDSYPRLTKLSASGNKLWDVTLGPRYYDNPYSLKQTADGGYIIAGAGYRYPGYTNQWYAWIMKTNASGGVQWKRNFPPSSGRQFVLLDTEVTPDGGYVAAGFSLTATAGSYDGWMVKTDAAGVVLWEQSFGGPENDWFTALSAVSSEGYTAVGNTASSGAGATDIWVVRVGPDGGKMWEKTIGGPGSDAANGAADTRDGGLVIAGHTDSDGAGGLDGWLVKLGGAVGDDTPPVSTATVTPGPNAYGWNREDVVVTLTGSDDQSGVATIEYRLGESPWTVYQGPFMVSVEGQHTLYYCATDNAGNREAARSLEIWIDKTPPSISGAPDRAANEHGWYNADVTVSFTAVDTLSGVSGVSGPVTLGEGANQEVTGTATDLAGNTASYTVSGISIDKTAPGVVLSAPADGDEYLLNAIVAADWSAHDALSGLATVAGTVPSGQAIDTGTVGAKNFAVTASDLAGNETAIAVTYYVRYGFSGILPPLGTDRAFNLGSVVPVKFRLTDASGSFIDYAQARLYLAPIDDGTTGAEVVAVAAGNANTRNLFRYDEQDDQYVFNLDTKNLSAGSWQLRIELDDGTSQYESMALEKRGGAPTNPNAPRRN